VKDVNGARSHGVPVAVVRLCQQEAAASAATVGAVVRARWRGVATGRASRSSGRCLAVLVAVRVAAIDAFDADAVVVAAVAGRVAIGVTAAADGRRTGRALGTGNNRDTAESDAAASGHAESDAVAHAADAIVVAADSVRGAAATAKHAADRSAIDHGSLSRCRARGTHTERALRSFSALGLF